MSHISPELYDRLGDAEQRYLKRQYQTFERSAPMISQAAYEPNIHQYYTTEYYPQRSWHLKARALLTAGMLAGLLYGGLKVGETYVQDGLSHRYITHLSGKFSNEITLTSKISSGVFNPQFLDEFQLEKYKEKTISLLKAGYYKDFNFTNFQPEHFTDLSRSPLGPVLVHISATPGSISSHKNTDYASFDIYSKLNEEKDNPSISMNLPLVAVTDMVVIDYGTGSLEGNWVRMKPLNSPIPDLEIYSGHGAQPFNPEYYPLNDEGGIIIPKGFPYLLIGDSGAATGPHSHYMLQQRNSDGSLRALDEKYIPSTLTPFSIPYPNQ